MSERFKSAGEAKDATRTRSRLFAKPDELLVEEHAPRILMPVPPPRYDEEDAFARLHSIDAEPDEDVGLSTGPLRVFVGPPDNRAGALKVGAREEVPLPRDESVRPRMAGISLRDDARRDDGRRADARPMSAAARSTGLDEDLLRTEIPFDLLGGDGDLPPPRVGRDATALPTIKRSIPGIQVRLRGAPTPPPPPPVEDPDVLAAGSEEDDELVSGFPAVSAEEAFPTLPELPLDTPAIEPPRVLTRPPTEPRPEPPRSSRPNLFDDAAPASPNRARPKAPEAAPTTTSRWWVAVAALAIALGFGVWRWESTYPGSILALGAALRPSPTIAVPNAATAVAPPVEATTIAAPSAPLGEPSATPVPPTAAPPAPEPTPVPAPAPVEAVVAATPAVDPAPAAPVEASDRRQTFKMPTGRILIVCDRKATIYVDNVKKGLTTDQRPIELTAGNHTVRLVAGGRSKTQQVRVDSEELRMIQFRF